jgi:hypothetical protein
MSPWARAWLGAALGALTVLIVHPMSRPYYQAYLWGLGPSAALATSPYLTANVQTPPEPNTDVNAAYWVALVANYSKHGRPIRRNDASKIARLCAAYAELDPENAFWRQTLSVMLHELGDLEASRRQWIRASYAARWSDFETQRLELVLDKLREESGASMAWHFAALYPQRSDAIAQMIQRHAERVLAGPFRDASEELDLRVATIVNGSLLRQNARSLDAGFAGAGVVSASYLPLVPTGALGSRRDQLAHRFRLIDRLRTEGRGAEALQTETLFRENDGWQAFAEPQAARAKYEDATRLALIFASVPGISLLVATFGALVALSGAVIERSPRAQLLFSPMVCAVVGVLLALSLYAVTRMVAPALWVAFVLGFFAFVPAKVRSRTPADLGLGYAATIAGLAILVSALLGFFLLGLGSPGMTILPALHVPREFGSGSVVVLAIIGILLGLTLATAPAWGIVQRLSAPRLAGMALRRLGACMVAGCLVTSLLAGPVAVVVDHHVAAILRMQFQNEPLYLMP